MDRLADHQEELPVSFAKTFEEAKARYKPMQRKPMKRCSQMKQGSVLKRSRMKQYRPSSEERSLRAEVLKRDGSRCQWPGGCATGDTRIDVHHLAERSQRPDLKLGVDNCKAICRTHHDWIPMNRAKAIEMGMLNPETYEAARKRLNTLRDHGNRVSE